jgi:DNA-binding XRE family transcriptional regulator
MTIVTTRIKELRARYNLTQDDLADMVGVTRQTMLYLEKGKYNPSLVLAYKVAKALHATIEEVFEIVEET